MTEELRKGPEGMPSQEREAHVAFALEALEHALDHPQVSEFQAIEATYAAFNEHSGICEDEHLQQMSWMTHLPTNRGEMHEGEASRRSQTQALLKEVGLWPWGR